MKRSCVLIQIIFSIFLVISINESELFSMAKDPCIQWNCTIATRPLRKERAIMVTVGLPRRYQDCFTSFYLLLKKVNSDLGEYCDQRGLATVKKIEIPSVNGTHEFQELSPGNYCIIMKPTVGFGKYRPLMNEIVELSEPAVPLDVIKPSESKQQSKNGSTSYEGYFILAAGLVALVVIPVTVMCVLKERSKRRHSKSNLSCRGECDNGNTEIQIASDSVMPQENPKPQVWVLYRHESEEFERVVEAFVRFLRCVIEVDVVTDSEFLYRIMVNPEGWIDGLMDKFWPDRHGRTTEDSPNKIIIVESKGAAMFYNDRLQLKVEERPENENCLDYVTARAFLNLTSTIQCFEAHNKLMVVRFDFTPEEYKINCLVPNMRYAIPRHLPYVYMKLTSRSLSPLVDGEYTQKLISQWQNTVEYRSLLDSIDAFPHVTM